jgi:hypothetical protein
MQSESSLPLLLGLHIDTHLIFIERLKKQINDTILYRLKHFQTKCVKSAVGIHASSQMGHNCHRKTLELLRYFPIDFKWA